MYIFTSAFSLLFVFLKTSQGQDFSLHPRKAGTLYVPGFTVAVPEKCPDSGEFMDLNIMIPSALHHFQHREGIRLTWGSYAHRRNLGLLFVLGDNRDTGLEEQLEKEQILYGDIVRNGNIDTYNNLTLKTMSIMEWVDTYCSKVKFVLKVDGDVFLNVPRLMLFIEQHRHENNAIFGNLIDDLQPHRNASSKWFVTRDEYKFDLYPRFASGTIYLVTGEIVGKLYDTALTEDFFKFEDVFMLGMVAKKLGVKQFYAEPEFLVPNMSSMMEPCKLHRGISMENVIYSQQFTLWKNLMDGETKC